MGVHFLGCEYIAIKQFQLVGQILLPEIVGVIKSSSVIGTIGKQQWKTDARFDKNLGSDTEFCPSDQGGFDNFVPGLGGLEVLTVSRTFANPPAECEHVRLAQDLVEFTDYQALHAKMRKKKSEQQDWLQISPNFDKASNQSGHALKVIAFPATQQSTTVLGLEAWYVGTEITAAAPLVLRKQQEQPGDRPTVGRFTLMVGPDPR